LRWQKQIKFNDTIYIYTHITLSIVVSLSTWWYLIIHSTSFFFYIYKENKENICNIVRLTEWNYLETKPLNVLPVQIERQSFNVRKTEEKANFFFSSFHYCTLEWTERVTTDWTTIGQKKKRKKKTIEGNTFERGQNTEQQYKRESEWREKGQQAGNKWLSIYVKRKCCSI
jgi:hypothetical protein